MRLYVYPLEFRENRASMMENFLFDVCSVFIQQTAVSKNWGFNSGRLDGKLTEAVLVGLLCSLIKSVFFYAYNVFRGYDETRFSCVKFSFIC